MHRTGNKIEAGMLGALYKEEAARLLNANSSSKTSLEEVKEKQQIINMLVTNFVGSVTDQDTVQQQQALKQLDQYTDELNPHANYSEKIKYQLGRKIDRIFKI